MPKEWRRSTSGKCLMGVPRGMIDMPTVEPSRPPHGSSTSVDKKRNRPATGRAAGCQTQWLGPCCGGSHYWGHGKGHKAHNGGKIYKCGACNQVLKQKLSPTEQIQQKTAAEEARLLQDMAAMNDDEFDKWSTGRG